MMKNYLIAAFILVVTISATTLPSKYVSRTGHIHVESHSTYLDVVADNYQVYCEINPNTGLVKIKGLTKSFEFKLGAIDRAFNSDRFNLSEFAKFNFDGQVTNMTSIKFDKPGSYPIQVDGNLMIGSYIRKTSARGTLVVKNDGSLRTDTSFKIRIEEESVQTINQLMKQKLPSMIALDADKLGVSRDIQLELNASFRPRR